MPAVIASFSFLALAIRSAVRIGRLEGLRDHDICVRKLALKHGPGPVLVGGDNESAAIRFKVFAEA
jgi:hypothetical protein